MKATMTGMREPPRARWALYALAALVSLWGPSLQAQRIIKMQFFEVAPHIYIDEKTGKVTGAVYDLLERYVAPEIGVKFQWEAVPIPRQMVNYEKMKEKNLGSAWLARTPERARMKHMVFTAQVLFPDSPALVVRNSCKLRAVKTIDDISGLTIGYSSEAFISPFMRDPRIHFEMVQGSNYYPANYKKLKSGRIDAVYAGSGTILLHFTRAFHMESDVRILYLPEPKTMHFVTFSSDARDVADRYNKAYMKLNVPQLYLKLLGNYIDTSKLSK